MIRSKAFQKYSYILLYILVTGSLLISFLSVNFLLFASVTGRGDRNGLEIFGIILFGLPAAVIYSVLNMLYVVFNKKTYQNLDINNQRANYYVINFVAAIVVSILLCSVYNSFVDNFSAAVILGLIYGLIIVSGGIFDLLVTFETIWSAGPQTPKPKIIYPVKIFVLIPMFLILGLFMIVIANQNSKPPPPINNTNYGPQSHQAIYQSDPTKVYDPSLNIHSSGFSFQK